MGGWCRRSGGVLLNCEERMREDKEQARKWEERAAGKSEERRTSPGLWFMVLLAAAAVGNIISLRRRMSNFHRMQQQARNTSRREGSFQGPNFNGSWSFRVDKPNVYEGFWYGEKMREGQRFKESPFIWDEVFEELERKERIRRMQDAFHRERAGYTRSYEKWQEHPWHSNQFPEGQTRDGANKNKQKVDREQHYKSDIYRRAGLRQHYAVLGLDPLRPQPYTEVEIKAAFRHKVMEYHPDRNQGNKEYSEVKFRQVMDSYEVLKQQHKFS